MRLNGLALGFIRWKPNSTTGRMEEVLAEIERNVKVAPHLIKPIADTRDRHCLRERRIINELGNRLTYAAHSE